MNSFPYNYESLNEYNGLISPTGRVQYDQTTFYFWRALYHRLLSVFRFDLPAEWNKRYFENVLYCMGFVGIVKTDLYGVIPQICSPTGYGLYLQPTELIVSQPLVQFRGTIGKDCELFMLTPDFCGVLDIVDHYAKQLSSIYTSFMVSSETSRASLIAFAHNKSASETLKIIAERISAGESLVVADKTVKRDLAEGDPLFMQAYDVHYIGSELLENMTKVMNDFDREIGIPIISEKKERRIVSEVAAVASDAGARITTWKEALDESIDRVERLFGIRISYTCTADEIEESMASVEGEEVPQQ